MARDTRKDVPEADQVAPDEAEYPRAMKVASASRVSRIAMAALAMAAIAVVDNGAPTGAAVPCSRTPSQSRALPRTGAVPHSGILPPRNPPKNLPPNPNFYAYCTPGKLDDTLACNSKALQAVNRARANERIGSLRFSLAKFLKLSVADQLFVIADLERVSRGAADDGTHGRAGQGGAGRRHCRH